MKTYNDLFNKICTINNFKIAYNNATKGKKHYKEVKGIERKGVNKYLINLLNEVKSKKYKVSNYKVFKKYTGHKWREIYKLPMKDRIVQHAIMIYLEPIFRETFIIDTYSSIKTRGIHLALKRVKKKLKSDDYKYCLKLDIHKCYPSLDKNILKTKLANKFKDKDLLWLLYEIIDSCENGVPIGNYTSQYFNNFYFSSFDHWLKEIKQVKAYFRYCDDMVILCKTKEELHNLFNDIKIEIEKLNVHIKDNYQIFPIEQRGIDFVGYVIRKDYIRIRKTTKNAFICKVRKMDINNLTYKDINVLGSYWVILNHADCRNLWYKYIGMKTFKDLNISIHKRDFVKDITYVPLIITKSWIFQKRGQDWLRFECNYKLKTTNNEEIENNNVLISTSGECLVEAGKQFNSSMFPFQTTIIINDKGFYEFT